jgi:hypothetical protein
MNIDYIFEGKPYRLTYENLRWSGGHPGYAEDLNDLFIETVGRYEYYPTPWHRVNHVATVLGGKLDTPKPTFATGEKEGVVY